MKQLQFYRKVLIIVLNFALLLIISMSFKRLLNDEIATQITSEKMSVNIPSITICLDYEKQNVFTFEDISKQLEYFKKQILVILSYQLDFKYRYHYVTDIQFLFLLDT